MCLFGAIIVHNDKDLNVVRITLHHDRMTENVFTETDHPVTTAIEVGDSVSLGRVYPSNEGDKGITVPKEMSRTVG